MSSLSEEKLAFLLGRIALKDREAFDEFVRITYKKLWSYIYRLCRDEEMAREIMNEVYLEVWKRADGFRGDSKVITWLLKVARNLTLGAIKKQSREVFIDDVDERNQTLTVSTEDPISELESKELAEILLKAMDRLSSAHREILDLVFLQGLRYAEIAKLLGIPVNTVKTRVFYAKKRLLDILTQWGISIEDLL